jgi:hypothetical protein
LDRKSIRAATREIATVACTRGREDIEMIVESIADISQMENKSSQRRAVCEMTIEPSHELQPELRELLTKLEAVRELEAVRDGQQGKEQTCELEKHQVDLQAGKKVSQKRRTPAVPQHVIQQEIERRTQQERGMGIER